MKRPLILPALFALLRLASSSEDRAQNTHQETIELIQREVNLFKSLFDECKEEPREQKRKRKSKSDSKCEEETKTRNKADEPKKTRDPERKTLKLKNRNFLKFKVDTTETEDMELTHKEGKEKKYPAKSETESKAGEGSKKGKKRSSRRRKSKVKPKEEEPKKITEFQTSSDDEMPIKAMGLSLSSYCNKCQKPKRDAYEGAQNDPEIESLAQNLSMTKLDDRPVRRVTEKCKFKPRSSSEKRKEKRRSVEQRAHSDQETSRTESRADFVDKMIVDG